MDSLEIPEPSDTKDSRDLRDSQAFLAKEVWTFTYTYSMSRKVKSIVFV